MNEQTLLDRIMVNSEILGGKPVIHGLRMAVAYMLGMLATGETPEAILNEYPFLEREDLQAYLLVAQRAGA